MRIVHLLASTGWGGAERLACTLHRLALAHGHTSRVDGPSLPALLSGLADEIGYEPRDSLHERVHAGWILGARRRTRRFAPDLVHIHLTTPGLTAAAWFIARGYPAVVTFHLLPRKQPWPKDYLMPIRSPRVLEWFGRANPRPVFVAVSEKDRTELSTYFPRADTRLVTNAPPLPPVRDVTPPKLEYPEGAVRLLSVGRLDEQKGFDRLLNALADPRLRTLSWHWVVVGDGAERARLEATAAARGLGDRVTFAGSLPAHHLFGRVDLVLSPSRYEGMPLVPLEALLARTPILVSMIPAHIEMLGAVPGSFLPDDESRWASALIAPLSDPSVRKNLRDAQSAVSRVDARERLWQEYKAIYEQLSA
jgi:glycosyltransferase involved in cell wall biosynthesis